MVEPETDARCQGVGVFIGAAPPVEIADVTGHEQTFERLDVRNQLAHAGIVVFTGIETCRDCPRICECLQLRYRLHLPSRGVFWYCTSVAQRGSARYVWHRSERMREREMLAMRQVIRRMPGSHRSGATARRARGVIGIRRVWAHECGAEAIEVLALVAALIGLLALLSLVVRDRASAIGGAATATLTRWLAGALGAAPVGGAAVITPPTVTAPPHTIVSLPQLLAQTTDAAPWATWGIGIAGSLLSTAAAWRTATGGALPADAEAWLRPVGAALDWVVRQGAGLVIGFVEGVSDTIAGLVTLVGDLGNLIAGDAATRRKYGALLDALVRDPLGTLARIFEAIIAPIVTD